jgi:hypothetical protein
MPERRKLPRYVVGSSGTLAFAGVQAETVSVLVLGMGGALIEGPNLPRVGEHCTLKIASAGSEAEFAAEVRSRPTPTSAGLMFLGVEEEGARLLRRICAGRPLALEGAPKGR